MVNVLTYITIQVVLFLEGSCSDLIRFLNKLSFSKTKYTPAAIHFHLALRFCIRLFAFYKHFIRFEGPIE
jgi:hypothetical protein